MFAQMMMVLFQSREPLTIVEVVVMVPVVVREQWIVTSSTGVEDEPRIDARLRVRNVVIVAETVVHVVRSREQVQGQEAGIEVDVRNEVKPGREVNRLVKIDRRKQHPAPRDRIVPISFDVDITTRCPNVVGRNPDPADLMRCPETGAPNVALAAPNPTAGHPGVFIRRGRTRRTPLDALRWRW